MIVWIVEGGWHYEGGIILGIYNTLEKAKDKEKETIESKEYYYDYINITEWEVE